MDFSHIQKDLERLCRQYEVERLLFFGSVMDQDRFGSESDVDVLIEFPSDETPGLFLLGRIQQELQSLIGRPVDLKTPGFFSEKARQEIEANSITGYERTA